jgi:hypothetical protein
MKDPVGGVTAAIRVVALVAALGLIGAVTFGVMWWRTEHGSPIQTAMARDSALASARPIAVNAALSGLDPVAGKATAIAALDASTTKMLNGAPSQPINKQVRIQLVLVRTPDAGWKAAAAEPIMS